MAEAALYNCNGEKIDQVTLPDQLFDAAPNHTLVYQAAIRLGRVRRVGSVNTQRRSDVSKTSAKWYRQKGTGHARHGSRSASVFVGGNKPHGPHGRKTTDGLPKRVRRQAAFAVLSERRRQARLTVVDELAIEDYSTRRFREILDSLEAFGKILVVIGPGEDPEERIYRSGRNIPGVTIRVAPHLSLDDLLHSERIVLTRAGLNTLEEVWLS
ncbi:MAG: 50S ribosomal protein L4 [Armatimonadetes bacterium]|nr:50S ribosomal protein L4 [Armatimonadota bacterium]